MCEVARGVWSVRIAGRLHAVICMQHLYVLKSAIVVQWLDSDHSRKLPLLLFMCMFVQLLICLCCSKELLLLMLNFFNAVLIRYYVVLVQYAARLNADKLKKLIHQMNGADFVFKCVKMFLDSELSMPESKQLSPT